MIKNTTKIGKNISVIQCALTLLYVVAMVVSNVLAAKQYIFIGGTALNCGTLTFPITYILSDLFSEIYGYKWSRFSCYAAFSACLFMVIFFEISIAMPYPDFWANQEAFATVLGSAPRMLFASLLAFVAGDFVNDKVFRKMKEKHGGELKGFGVRAVLSSLIGETVDSLIFFPIAFTGIVPLNTMVITAIALILMKVGYECIIFPVTKLIAKKLLAYENKATAIVG